MAKPSSGKVYLIGAGPGDPGLITVKGMQIIRQADVVVFDSLANASFIRQAGPTSETLYVGKRGGCHSMKQADINALLIEKASEGKTVARLKGGDPFVFGRGGEEALELVRHGIDFEVVPGVTAAIAATAYAGIPATHRGIATSFGVVTGHEDPTKPESTIDWSRVATGTDTLAIYMGMRNIRDIVGKLIGGGRDASTPAAVITWGTTPAQRCVTGTLETIADAAAEAGLRAPGIIVVGHVVSLREELNWFEKLPLFGRRIILTRSHKQSEKFEQALLPLGAEVIVMPTIQIEPLKDLSPLNAAIAELGSYDWAIFTSVNAVQIFMDRLKATGRDARSFGSCKIAAIGPATAQAIEERFLRVDFIPPDYVAEAFLDAFTDQHQVNNARILLPRAKAARPLLVNELREVGAEVNEVTLYDTVPETDVDPNLLQVLKAGELDAVTFTSASTVRSFVNLIGKETAEELSRSVVFASIGPITTQTAHELGLHIEVEAAEHTTDGLIRALCDYYARS